MWLKNLKVFRLPKDWRAMRAELAKLLNDLVLALGGEKKIAEAV